MRVHVLHLRVGDERYALPTASVVEVVPAVPLRPVPGTPEAVAGLLAYRGQVVPVVDLPRLLGRGAAPVRLSTRIAVCDRDGALGTLGTDVMGPPHSVNSGNPGGAGGGGRRRLVGVLAERV